ncbi:unnamed protein product [Calypogeia fissa]
MGPTFFFMGMCALIMTWAVTSLGLPYDWWTYFIPCLSVFLLCDHQKLSREVVREFTKPFRGMAVVVAAVSSLYRGILPLTMVIPLVCILSLVRGFSFEKMMFIGDECGELAKFVWWRIFLRWVPFINKMSWKGLWACCSPYSRGPVHQIIEYYYILCPKKLERAIIPRQFEVNFRIEECSVLCKYFVSGNSGRYSETDNVSRAKVPPIRQEAMVWKDDQGASSSHSESAIVAEAASSDTENVMDLRRQKHVNKVQVTLSLQNGGTSAPGPLPARSRAASPSGWVPQAPSAGGKRGPALPKAPLEGAWTGPGPCAEAGAGVWGEEAKGTGEELETWTFFPSDLGQVAEIELAMKVLEKSKNLIFARVHKNMGSRNPKAHAKCYELKEIFELILTKGYTVERVTLTKAHECSISGSTMLDLFTLIPEIAFIGVLTWMNFYELLSAAPHYSLIVTLILFIFFQLLIVLLKFFLGGRERLLYSFISLILPPAWVDGICLKLQRIGLSWGNESYGGPFVQDCSTICKFFDEESLPASSEHEELLPARNVYEHVGESQYDLRNLYLDLKINPDSQEGEDFIVKVCIKWKTDNALFYSNRFVVQDTRKISNLIGMLIWLKENKWQGICKSWPKKTVMHVFSFKELICKTLDKDNYHEPILFFLEKEVRMSVE